MNHPIDLDHITPEQAIQGTIEMWTDMKDALGEITTPKQRNNFKRKWLREHGYKSIFLPASMSSVSCDCFLCESAFAHWCRTGFKRDKCDYCPIHWPDEGKRTTKCRGNILDYTCSPISDILAYIQDEKNRR